MWQVELEGAVIRATPIGVPAHNPHWANESQVWRVAVEGAVMESRAGNARAARLVLDALLQVSTSYKCGQYPYECGTYMTVTARFRT